MEKVISKMRITSIITSIVLPAQAKQINMSSPKIKIKQNATCPNCLNRFLPEDVLWIASHQSLVGDRKLPVDDAMMRFLPSRFTMDGFAIDPKGIECKKMACPLCHLEIPRCVLDTQTNFFSILGTRGSGKSFFLASMTHELRRIMKENFELKFFDPDPTFNRPLLENENKIFYNKDPNKLTALNELVDRTQHLHENLYNQVKVSGQIVNYAKPFIFQVDPLDTAKDTTLRRKLITLYDNSGESFQLGMDNDVDLVTLHMSKADALLFVFDPTQYPGVKQAAEKNRLGSMKSNQVYSDNRQEMVLTESISRICRYKGYSSSMKYEKPVIVILTKWDTWSHLTPDISTSDPYEPILNRNTLGLSISKVKKASSSLKQFLQQYAPNIVNTCESFANNVFYIPISSLGKPPSQDSSNSLSMIRPGDIHPVWVTVPLVLATALTTKELIPLAEKTSSKSRHS